MAARGKYQSLKGKSALWSGVDRRSLYLPLAGTFREITNAAISSEGTEIARLPGWTRIAEPRNNDGNAITTITAGFPTRVITVGDDMLVQVGDVVRISGSNSMPTIDGEWIVTVQNVTSENETSIYIPVETTGGGNAGTVTVTHQRFNHRLRQLLGHVVVAGECTYSRRCREAADAADDGHGALLHVIITSNVAELIFDRPHGHDIGIEFQVRFTAAVLWYPEGAATEPNIPGDPTVHTATSTGPFSATIPFAHANAEYVRPATATELTLMYVRTNLPTFFTIRSEPVIGSVASAFDIFNSPARAYWTAYPTENPLSAANATPNETFMSFVRRKGRCDMSEGKIILALPGQGLVWQLDIRSWLGGMRVLRTCTALGMPQGRIISAAASGSGLFNGTFYFAVAYRMRDRKEIGIYSPTIQVAGLINQGVAVAYVKPQWVQPELPAEVDTLLFAGPSSTSLQLVTTIMEDYTWESATDFARTVVIDDARRAFDPLYYEQQPMGCIDSATARGFTVFGGSPGFDFDDEGFNRIYTSISLAMPNGRFRVQYRALMAGGRYMLASYRDQDVLRLSTNSVPGSTLEAGARFTEIAPTEAAFPHRELFDTDLTTATTVAGSNYRASRLVLPRGRAWSSEAGFPGKTNVFGLKITDSVWGEDVEAVGRWRDQFVMATRKETFVLSFGRSPLESDPQLVSGRYGAIGPMVEFDDGVAWLSDIGPVALTAGGVEWIGDPVKDLFALAKRDSKGLMGHACLGYDRANQLVYFGLRRDIYDVDGIGGTATGGSTIVVTCNVPHGLPIGERRLCRISGAGMTGIKTCLPLSTTTVQVWSFPGSSGGAVTLWTGYAAWSEDFGGDDRRSKMGCDFFLVWSPRTGAWSTWQPPAHLADIHDMWPLRFDDGVERLAFLAHGAMDAAIYAFDEGWLDSVQLDTVVTGTVAAGHLGAKDYFEASVPIGTGTATKVGMGFLIRAADGVTLRGYGHVLGIDSSARVRLGTMATPLGAQTLTLVAGDTIQIGLIHMRLVTNRFNPLGDDWESRSGMRSLVSRHELQAAAVDGVTLGDAWLTMQAATDDGESTGTIQFAPKKLEQARTRVEKGLSNVKEHQLTLDSVGALRTRIKDLLMEASD